MSHETHPKDRLNWLRAAVLGANDGIVSTASLLTGLVASSATDAQVRIAGLAGMVAGALSMAAGEYVSVASQADAERANVAKETAEQMHSPEAELAELTEIYVRRGLHASLAAQVAEQLTAHDALGAHLRDELGILESSRARPVQASLVSVVSFIGGGIWPLLASAWVPMPYKLPFLAGLALFLLMTTGALAASLGGASAPRAALRVGGWGALAMAITALLGRWVGAHLG
jgi:VIT1/CCC1 family predicted Fe2+/Mn2+ transporter